MIAIGSIPAAAAFVIPVCRQSWNSRIGRSTPARPGAAFTTPPKSPDATGDPFSEWQKTRSPAARYAVLRHCCHGASANGSATAIVHAPHPSRTLEYAAWVGGLSTDRVTSMAGE
jgi:hypothetical protein